MFNKLFNTLNILSTNRFYWLGYAVGGTALLVMALFFQYVLEELPCVVCIQIRLWFSLLVIVAIAGLWLRNSRVMNILIQAGVVLISAGLIERSYLLLGTERGFVFSDCGFDAGLPAWFAIESWLPWIYQVEASCGYTPELILGITMAETLMVLSVLLMCLSLAVLISALFKSVNKQG